MPVCSLVPKFSNYLNEILNLAYTYPGQSRWCHQSDPSPDLKVNRHLVIHSGELLQLKKTRGFSRLGSMRLVQSESHNNLVTVPVLIWPLEVKHMLIVHIKHRTLPEV